MNQKVKELDLEKMLFWDLEVVRGQEELIPDTEEYHLFEQKNRNRDTDEVLPEAELQELYKRKGGLNLTLNKIVCLSMGVVVKNKIYLKSITGEQGDIIREFSDVLNKGYIPVGWNIVGFDFPVLRQKAFQEGILDYAPERFNDAGKKEWAITELKYNINILDLMLTYKGTYYYNQSLAEACYSAGIPSPKNGGIEGSKVSEVYYKEGVERIARYCERDVLSCVHLFQKMRGEELIQDIVHRSDVKLEEPTVLEKLYATNQLTANIKEEVDALVGKKKLSKKDKENLFTILRGVYIRADFENFDQDTKAVIAQKEAEINEFINTL